MYGAAPTTTTSTLNMTTTIIHHVALPCVKHSKEIHSVSVCVCVCARAHAVSNSSVSESVWYYSGLHKLTVILYVPTLWAKASPC